MVNLYCDGGLDKVCYVFEDCAPVVIDLPSETTNNTSEYLAVIRGLEAALRLHWKDLTVLSDSQLVVRQLSGEYKIKKPHLAKLNTKVKALAKEFNTLEFCWIPREKNLAGIELDKIKESK